MKESPCRCFGIQRAISDQILTLPHLFFTLGKGNFWAKSILGKEFFGVKGIVYFWVKGIFGFCKE